MLVPESFPTYANADGNGNGNGNRNGNTNANEPPRANNPSCLLYRVSLERREKLLKLTLADVVVFDRLKKKPKQEG